MKKISKAYNRYIFICSLFVFYLSSSFVQICNLMGSYVMYENNIGWPFLWLTIYSDTKNRSVHSLMYQGNLGISINILELVKGVVFYYALLYGLYLLFLLIKSKIQKNKQEIEAE